MGRHKSNSSDSNSKHDLVDEVTVMIADLKNPAVSEKCIYKAPLKVRQINEAAYTPRVISIGPYHHDDKRLKSMESMQQLKLIYLKSLLDRNGLQPELCIKKLKERETEIQNCYAEEIQRNSDEFVKMILIDACFIVEHLLRYNEVDQWCASDPLFSKPWLLHDVSQDMLLLENQIPFFVLEDLYNLATNRDCEDNSFLCITLNYYRGLNGQKKQLDEVRDLKHFTDLLRMFYLPTREKYSKKFSDRTTEVKETLDHLYSASELKEAGLKFKVDKTKTCLLELQNDKGVLTMPRLVVSDRTEIHLRNIVAFEQCHYPWHTYITDYLMVLDSLINSERDVDILIHEEIIKPLMGDSSEVATMINSLCSNLLLLTMNKHYLNICGYLKAFYDSPINKWKASLIHDYFNTPVKAATSITAIVLVILTLVQTVCSIYPLVKDS